MALPQFATSPINKEHGQKPKPAQDLQHKLGTRDAIETLPDHPITILCSQGCQKSTRNILIYIIFHPFGFSKTGQYSLKQKLSGRFWDWEFTVQHPIPRRSGQTPAAIANKCEPLLEFSELIPIIGIVSQPRTLEQILRKDIS